MRGEAPGSTNNPAVNPRRALDSRYPGFAGGLRAATRHEACGGSQLCRKQPGTQPAKAVGVEFEQQAVRPLGNQTQRARSVQFTEFPSHQRGVDLQAAVGDPQRCARGIEPHTADERGEEIYLSCGRQLPEPRALALEFNSEIEIRLRQALSELGQLHAPAADLA